MDSKGRRAVFVDRDGVINKMCFNADFGLIDSPGNPDQFELLPGVGRALRSLNEIGLALVVVSNQPGIAKGKFTPALLGAMEDKMLSGIAAEAVRWTPSTTVCTILKRLSMSIGFVATAANPSRVCC